MRRCILVAATLLCGCPPSGPPDPDSCSPGVATGVTGLQIGPGADSAGNAYDGPFHAYADGDAPQFAFGGQGFIMLPVRLAVAGTPPACLQQSTILCVDATCSDGGFARSDVGLRTYADGSRRATKPLYIVLGGGFAGDYPSLTVRSTVGGLVTTVHLGQPAVDLFFAVPGDMTTD